MRRNIVVTDLGDTPPPRLLKPEGGMGLSWKHMVGRKVWREWMYAALRLHADEMGVTYRMPWPISDTRTLITYMVWFG